jgi:hypothetical protein
MAWKRNPRLITDEQFSDGTTIDGNRLDNALDDVVTRANDIPYGDLRKRWVPMTYVAGWTPQSPMTIGTSNGAVAYDAGSATYANTVSTGHRWPWLPVPNNQETTAKGSLGSADGDDVVFTNPYRLKGASVPGIYLQGQPTATVNSGDGVITYTPAGPTSIGLLFAWTRSWFLERPAILDAIDMHLVVDHPLLTPTTYANDFKYGTPWPSGQTPNGDSEDLVVMAHVDSEFSKEDRNMSDIEVMRRGFKINRDTMSFLPLPKSTESSTLIYSDMTPYAGQAAAGATYGVSRGGTLTGRHIELSDLNIPLHQNTRLRVSVCIPFYDADRVNPGGWEMNDVNMPWYTQQMNMTVTMLEEVMRG